MAIEHPAAASGTDSGTELTTLRMVIGGESVDAADGQTFEVVHPANGATIATAPLDEERLHRPAMTIDS